MSRCRLSALVRAVGLLVVVSLVTEWHWAQSVAKPTVPVTASRYERRLGKFERRLARLEGLLDSIVRPPLKFVESSGKMYRLPLSATDAEIEECSADELAYLSGFFDGNGCVNLHKNGTIRLLVGQSVRGLDVLLRFRRAFGGGIYRLSDGCGRTNPRISWTITGAAAKQAALLLARNSLTKKSQLCLAMNGNVAKERRSLARCQLKEFKAADTVPHNFSITWQYFCGFFDAEGYVKVRPDANCIELELWQKHRSIWRRLLSFLENEGLDSWRIHHSRNESSLLRCSTTDVSKQTLCRLLANGLSCKGEQAQIALQLNASNRGEIREKLFQLSGQQGRYIRLDSDGMERSAEIKRQRKRIHRCRDEAGLRALSEKLRRLQKEHRLENLQYTCRLMSSDIRRMLNEGASLKPIDHI